MKVTAIVNFKGGVAKSTTAITLSQNLAMQGKRVLLADNDPQGNVTKFFDLHDYEAMSMENVIADKNVVMKDIVRHTDNENLDILPSNMNLEGAADDLMMDTEAVQNMKLKNALEQVKDEYDICIIDCPPRAGITVINALTAADNVIIPIKIDKQSLDGMEEISDFIEEIKPYNKNLKDIKCLITIYNKDDSAGAEVLRNSEYDMFKTVIRYSKRVPDWSYEIGKSLQEITPRSAATRDYAKFTSEYLQMIGGDGHAEKDIK